MSFNKSEEITVVNITRPGALGDVLMNSWFVEGLKEKHQARIVYYTKYPEVAALIEGVDEVRDTDDWDQRTPGIDFYPQGYPFNLGYPGVPMEDHLLNYLEREFQVPKKTPKLKMTDYPIDSPYITISVKTGWSPYKNWSLDKWNEVVSQLLESYPEYQIIQLGGIDDPALTPCDRLLNLCSKTTIKQTVSLIKNAKLHLGLDSFTNHLAGIFETPAVILFGSTSPIGSGYASAKNIWLQLGCSPCYKEDPSISRDDRGICNNPPNQTYENPQHACMTGITVYSVLKAAKELLNKDRSIEVSEYIVKDYGKDYGAVYVQPSKKICVYGIALNEIKHVDRFMEAAKDADLVVIADTGSTDGTPERLRELGALVFDINIKPWRFDLARNSSLSLIPKDVDICVSLDLDEILQPGWRAEIERVWTPNTTRLSYNFDCNNGCVYPKDWIHSRTDYMWKHLCHETVVSNGLKPQVYAYTNMILALHDPDNSKSRGQYHEMLGRSVAEDPHSPRNSFYYARELTFHSQWNETIAEFTRYLDLPEATWIVERAYAMKCIGKAYWELGDHHNAEKWLHRSALEAPHYRDSWCELALMLYHQARWAECFAMSMKTLQITHREEVFTSDSNAWGYLPHDLASIAAWHLGVKSIAIEQARLAVNCAPDDIRLVRNLNALLE